MLEFPGTVGGPWDRYIDPATVSPAPRGAPQLTAARRADEGGPSPPAPLPQERGGKSAETAKPLASDPSIRIGTVKYPRTVPNSEEAARELKKRTLTNLYNQRPTWLDLAHQKLDAAVCAAYGWKPALSDDELLEKLLKLNLQRAARQ